MWSSTIAELIDLLLTGYEMQPADLERLLEKGKSQSEGHYLEAKQGHPQKDKGNPQDTIRRYVSGFANSDGGILLLGVADNWAIVGFEAPGNIDAAQWANDCIQKIAPYFSPLPRFQVVHHENGKVLVASSARSLNLIPVVENTKQHFYIRIHDHTTTMPDWMISDLMLGRRSYPYLHFSEVSISGLWRQGEDINEYLTVDFKCVVGNNSLVWAQNTTVGMIGWVYGTGSGQLGNHLLTYITIQEPCLFARSRELELQHMRQSAQQPFELDPFSERGTINTGWNIPLRYLDNYYFASWNAALYIIAKETPPVWYQLTLNINSQLLVMHKEQKLRELGSENLCFTRTAVDRPVVSWNP